MFPLILRRGKALPRNERGATMFEYAILVGVIALVAIGGATVFGTDLHDLFTKLGTSISVTNTTPSSN
jgi:pilus assembly protein Flp/PilA